MMVGLKQAERKLKRALKSIIIGLKFKIILLIITKKLKGLEYEKN